MNTSRHSAIQKKFPFFKRHPKMAYLDNAATTQKPSSVIAAMSHFYENSCANVHRGIYALSEEATAAYEGARTRVARFIEADRRGIVFTRNTTEAINLAAATFAAPRIKKGDEILIGIWEHHSNILPWQRIARACGACVRYIPLSADKTALDAGEAMRLITRRTRFVALSMMSNVLGTFFDAAPLIRAAHAHHAYVLLDAAQAAAHEPIRFKKLGADFLAFSGHKMYGPTGIGVLAGKPELMEQMEPYMVGGDMALEVSRTKAVWNEIPWKFEAGTPAIAEAAGLASAIDFMESTGFDKLQRHDAEIASYGIARLLDAPGVTLYGSCDTRARAPVFSFSVKGVHPHDLATVASEHGTAIRSGQLCAAPLISELGVRALARASCAIYNTADDIDRLIAAIRAAQKILLRT